MKTKLMADKLLLQWNLELVVLAGGPCHHLTKTKNKLPFNLACLLMVYKLITVTLLNKFTYTISRPLIAWGD